MYVCGGMCGQGATWRGRTFGVIMFLAVVRSCMGLLRHGCVDKESAMRHNDSALISIDS